MHMERSCVVSCGNSWWLLRSLVQNRSSPYVFESNPRTLNPKGPNPKPLNPQGPKLLKPQALNPKYKALQPPTP